MNRFSTCISFVEFEWFDVQRDDFEDSSFLYRGLSRSVGSLKAIAPVLVMAAWIFDANKGNFPFLQSIHVYDIEGVM